MKKVEVIRTRTGAYQADTFLNGVYDGTLIYSDLGSITAWATTNCYKIVFILGRI